MLYDKARIFVQGGAGGSGVTSFPPEAHGARGADLVVRVPPGTQVTDWNGTLYDLVVPGTRVVIAAGGPGGHGNKRFATAPRPAPPFAERGLPRAGGWVDL